MSSTQSSALTINVSEDADSGISVTELAAIESYWDENYYATSDILHSFVTSLGDHIDCIDFSAQQSVKALLARGVQLPPHNSAPPTSAAAQSANTSNAGGIDGTTDSTGNVRSCPAGSVPKMRPSIAKIEAAGGMTAYLQTRNKRPRLQNMQNSVEHDCWDNDYPLNYSVPPPDNFCSLWHGAGLFTQPCGNYDHAAGVQTGLWLPSHTFLGRTIYSNGFYGASLIVPIYLPTVDSKDPGGHTDAQFWMQTGTCENWWNGNNDAGAGQQCSVTPGCTSNCAVQSLEMAIETQSGATQSVADLFFETDGYASSYCFINDDCPFGSNGYYVQEPLTSYLPNEAFSGSTPGTTPLEIQLGATLDLTTGMYHIYMNNQWVGYFPATDFNWPTGAGPMVSGPATYLQAGGEVYQGWPTAVDGGSNYHAQTSMESDYAAELGYKYAAYVRDVEYVDSVEAFHNAAFTFLQEPTVPSYMGDENLPGICGFLAGEFLTEYNFRKHYDISTTADAGGSGWGTYFYFGTVNDGYGP